MLTVEIRLRDDGAYPNQYRDALLWRHDRSPLTADQFAYLVRELMPNWVKDIIRSESPDGANDLNDLQSDLQQLLDELRVPTKVLKPTLASVSPTFPTERNEAGTAEPEQTAIEAEQDEEHVEDGRRPAKATHERASKTRVRQAPQGATPSKLARALERAPEIVILTDPQDVADREMKGRAARFYGDVQTLFVNGTYPVVERMVEELVAEFVGADDAEDARALAVAAAQRTLAFRVGKATCFALAKRLQDDWSSEDLDRATSPESLSMAADDYRQSIAAAKRWMRDRVKMADVAALG